MYKNGWESNQEKWMRLEREKIAHKGKNRFVARQAHAYPQRAHMGERCQIQETRPNEMRRTLTSAKRYDIMVCKII